MKAQWNSSWHVATAIEAFTSAIIIRVENNILRCSFMFPSPQQRIHGLNAGLVPGSSPKDNFVDGGLNVTLWILVLELQLCRLGHVPLAFNFLLCGS